MKYTEKVMHIDFSGVDAKSTYLKACKWLATNIVSKEKEFGEVQYSINKTKQNPATFRVTVYAALDQQDVEDSMCNACREAHRLFYKNSEFCGTCGMQTFIRRMKEKIDIKMLFLKSRISK